MTEARSEAIKVLLVEDSEDDARLVVRLLQRDGFDVLHERVDDAKAMAAALAQQPWDLVIADYRMPGFTGLDALGILRATERDIPFVLVSATVGEDTAVEAMKAGVNDYLMKTNLTRLAAAVRRELGAARSRTEHRKAVERAAVELQASEGRLRGIVDSAMDAIITVDDQQRIVVFNPAAEHIFDSPEAEALGQSLDRFIPQRLRTAHAEHLEDFGRTGISERSMGKRKPLAALRGNGEEFPIESSISQYTLDGRRFYTAIVRDVSARVLAEANLGRLNAMYRTLSETNEALLRIRERHALFDEIAAIAARHGSFRIAMVWIRDPGTTRARVAAGAGEIGNYLDQAALTIDLATEEAQTPAGAASIEGWPEVCNDLGQDRTNRWGQLVAHSDLRSCAAFPLREDGEVVGALALYSTESGVFDADLIDLLSRMAANLSFALDGIKGEQARAVAEASLRESEARYRALTGLSSDWYWEQDENQRFTRLSDQVLEKSGIGKDALLGRTRWENGIDYDPADRAALEAHIEARRDFRDFQFSRTDAQGRPFHVQVSGEPMFDAAGRYVGYRGVGKDVTERRQHEEELRRFRTAMNATSEGIFLFDIASWRFVDCNDAFCRMLGYERTEVLQSLTPERIKAVPREEIERHFEAIVAGSTDIFPPETLYRCRDGSQVPVEVQRRAVRSSGAWIIVGVARDISARLSAERTIKTHVRQQELIAAFGQIALTNADIDVLLDRAVGVVDEGLTVDFFEILQLTFDRTSLVYRTGFGWEDAPKHRHAADAGPGTQYAHVLLAREPVLVEDFRQETQFTPAETLLAHSIRSGVQAVIGGADGPFGILGAYSTRLRHFPTESVNFLQGIANILAAANDRRESEEKAAYLAQFDALTDLPNRILFLDRLAQTIAQAQRNQWQVGVVVLDLNRYNVINETYGHAAGDGLLLQVAQRLQACVRIGDSVARLAGDRFGIVLTQLAATEDASIVAQKLSDAVTLPYEQGGQAIRLTASLGVALYPNDAQEANALIQCADTATYRAKDHGTNNVQFYTEALNARMRARAALIQALQHAVERQEFELHYQAQVSLHTGRVVGAEVLVRWRHPERGLIAPGEFIPLAEETGLIIPLGDWVLRAACAQAAAWRQAGRREIQVAVNVSSQQLRRGGFAAAVRAALEETGLEPSMLELELTETGIMESTDQFIAAMSELRSLGVSIAVDDFGTGYSSLSYLKRLPIDTIKIDRSFIRDVIVDPGDAAIARAIIAMSSHLKLKVVAEGVETAEQAAFLRRSGCDEVQGFLFGKPVAAEAFIELVDSSGIGPLLPAAAGTTRALLLVDDEDNNLRALQRVLRREGYEVHAATSARDAFAILAAMPIGVIVSDQRMPEMSGTEFLVRVKAMYPETVRIVLSGYTDLATVTAAINEGAIYKFLTKPWDDESLRRDIRSAFQLYDEQRRAA